jgi:hypothetical protein
VTASLSTAKGIYALQSAYKDAPMTILNISAELSILTASLANVQSLLHPRSTEDDFLEHRPDLAQTLDTSMVGCMVLLSCLDREVSCITSAAKKPGSLDWKAKMKTVWYAEKMNNMLVALRGQTQALGLIIQLFQT